MTHTGPGVLAALILGACLTAAVPETAASPAEPEVLVRTFAGDCTLGCDLGMEDTEDSFQNTVGEDYGYPWPTTIPMTTARKATPPPCKP